MHACLLRPVARLLCARRPRLQPLVFESFLFFKDTATAQIYTLSLHDALPISRSARSCLACPTNALSTLAKTSGEVHRQDRDRSPAAGERSRSCQIGRAHV